MANRPDIFNKQLFQNSLRRQGCTDNFVSPATSDFRLLVPLAIRDLGEEGVVDLFERSRRELELGEQAPAWKHVAKFFAGWAEEQIENYKTEKRQENGSHR